LLVSVALLLQNSSISHAQEEVENPVYSNWAVFKPGTTVSYRSITETPELKSVQEYSLTLKSVTKDKLVIERILTVVMEDGTRMDYPAMTSDNPRTYKLPKGAKRPDPAKPAGVKETGEEELEMLGEKIKTKWYKAVSKVEAGDTFTQSWTSAEIPGGLVKAINETPATKSVNTVELISMNIVR
jgi:hypothetical protein